MGYGAWNDRQYHRDSSFRAAAGIDDFEYSNAMAAKPWDQWKADPTLDPLGVTFRESRDSADHPNTTPIVLMFDVTGSMGRVPRIMQKQLADLHGLLLRKGYVEDPQIMFGAIGDAETDRVPLQVGQFESDNRMDEQLRTIFLEGGGGGQRTESYELAAYFLARHTATDAWEKRGRKGYVFIIGDEMNKAQVSRSHVSAVIGDRYAEPISVEGIYRELEEKWEVFYVLPNQTSYYNNPEINQHWRDLLGERLLKLDDPMAVCDLIALTIGMLEVTIDLDEGLSDLKAIGSTHGATVGKALATVGARRSRGGAIVATATPAGLDEDDDLI